ncbi:hypothetical protein KCV03_g395, partial [Aureobasidium melanogenum]
MFLTIWKLVGRPACLVQPKESLRLISSSCVNQISSKEAYLKPKTDPEKLLRNSLYKRRRYMEDSEYRNRILSTSRARSRASYETDGRYRNMRIMARWIYRYTWFREQLPWKSHRPVLYSEKLVRLCTKCGVKRRDGLKIWWESVESENHICHYCYTKADWSEMMPEGYQDCRSKKDLLARMQQLGA